MGFLADIKAMPDAYEYSLGFFNRFYRPENVTLLIVGDVQPQQVFELARKHYGDWKRGYQAPKVEAEPPQKQQKKAHIDWPNPVRPHLVVGYHIPAFSTASAASASLDLIEELLFSDSAPLYQELVVKNQWVDFIQGGAMVNRDPSLFLVIARIKSEELVPKVKEAVDRHVRQLQAEGADPQRLDRIKSHLRYDFAMGLDTPGGVARQASQAIVLAEDVDAVNQRFAQYQQVTAAEIQKIARETFTPQNETLVTLSHKAPAPAAQGSPGGANHD
jgi:zinc protease